MARTKKQIENDWKKLINQRHKLENEESKKVKAIRRQYETRINKIHKKLDKLQDEYREGGYID